MWVRWWVSSSSVENVTMLFDRVLLSLWSVSFRMKINLGVIWLYMNPFTTTYGLTKNTIILSLIHINKELVSTNQMLKPQHSFLNKNNKYSDSHSIFLFLIKFGRLE